RGLLPAASLSHVGVFATGQAYEQLLMRLLGSPLPEARRFGELALSELRKVIPAFVRRVDMPDRGPAWIEYLSGIRERASQAAARFGLADAQVADEPASVRLVHVDGSEEDLLTALVYEASDLPDGEIREIVSDLSPGERAALVRDLAGERENRRH